MGQEESSIDEKTNPNFLVTVIQNRNLTMIPSQLISPVYDKIMSLDLTGNHINTLPSNIPNLRTLILASNKLTSINDNLLNAIISYTKLEVIDLSLNDLIKVPDQILQIKTLTRLNIFGNKISYIDCSNTKIITIDCGQNNFEITPKFISNIQYLSFDMNLFNLLDLSSSNLIRTSFRINHITSISPKTNFPQLQVLDLSYNKLRELPDISAIAPNLKVFDASFNKIINFPRFPQSIIDIDLHMNQIEYIPNDISNYPNLGTLDISENNLKQIPEIPQQLITLLLCKNNITSIQKSDSPNLRHLSIFKNNLKEIPFFERSKIRDLYLFSNCITQINVSCIKKKVTKLDLTNNFIEVIPDELFDSKTLPNLLHIIIARNKIRELPSSFKNSTIISINISCNPFTQLPDEFPQTIESISVAHCGLSNLPESLSNCEELVELDASGNNLSSIPYLQNLTLLYLSMNKIVFFPEISPKIVSLDLSMNFINNIPNNLKLNKLQYADFSYNKLIDFPSSFIAPKLYSLKISHNPIISKVCLNSSYFPYLNSVDFSESNITIKTTKKFVFEHSDGSLIPSENTRFIHCDNWCAVARKRGLRESIEDAFIIRTSLQKNLNLFGLWDARSGGKTASIGAMQLTNYINNEPFEFSESYFEKYCSKMSEILNQRSFIDGSAMGICACTKTQMIYVNCGSVSIMIIGQSENASSSNSNVTDSSSITVDVIENTSIIQDELHNEMVESSSISQFTVLGLNIATHFVCGKRDFKPTDKWVIIASPGVTDIITPKEIAMISKDAETSYDLAYRIVTIARASSSTESASVIAYCIKEANSS